MNAAARPIAFLLATGCASLPATPVQQDVSIEETALLWIASRETPPRAQLLLDDGNREATGVSRENYEALARTIGARVTNPAERRSCGAAVCVLPAGSTSLVAERKGVSNDTARIHVKVFSTGPDQETVPRLMRFYDVLLTRERGRWKIGPWSMTEG